MHIICSPFIPCFLYTIYNIARCIPQNGSIYAYVGMRIEVEGGKRTKEEEREGRSDIVYTYMLR